MVKKKVVSQHIFMFPFLIENREADKKVSPDINEVYEAFRKSGWCCKTFEDEFSPAKYSEYFYFHKYVRDAIFGKSCKQHAGDIISYYFEREVTPDAEMTIHLKINESGSLNRYSFTLKIDTLSLRLFETGIGILAIELMNYNYTEMHDILLINDFGRRIYPQFLPDNGDIDIVKDSFLADRIELRCGKIKSVEPFPYEKFSGKNLAVAEYIVDLLGEEFSNKYEPVPVIDDRMFTVCWYGNDCWSNKLKEKKTENTDEMEYELSDEWYRFIFVDGKDIGCASRRMKRDLIARHTYDRWVEYGTFFGITRYSLMCITDHGDFACNIVRKHMERMYYQIAIILLAQRASILKFSADVEHLSGRIRDFIRKDTDAFDAIAEEVKELHASYIRFVNRLWFTEVTPQEQGIEMYEMALDAMGLKEQIAELKSEIKELYEFVDMQYEKEKTEEDRRSTRELNMLNMLAVVFLPLTVLAGLWGMNLYFIEKLFPDAARISWTLKYYIGSFALFLITCLVVYKSSSNLLGVIKCEQDSGKEKKTEDILSLATARKTFCRLNVFFFLVLLVLVYLGIVYNVEIMNWVSNIRQAGK